MPSSSTCSSVSSSQSVSSGWSNADADADAPAACLREMLSCSSSSTFCCNRSRNSIWKFNPSHVEISVWCLTRMYVLTSHKQLGENTPPSNIRPGEMGIAYEHGAYNVYI